MLVGKGNAILQKCCAVALSNNFASERGLALPCLIGKQSLLWLADVIYLFFFFLQIYVVNTILTIESVFFGVDFKAPALPL